MRAIPDSSVALAGELLEASSDSSVADELWQVGCQRRLRDSLFTGDLDRTRAALATKPGSPVTQAGKSIFHCFEFTSGGFSSHYPSSRRFKLIHVSRIVVKSPCPVSLVCLKEAQHEQTRADPAEQFSGRFKAGAPKAR